VEKGEAVLFDDLEHFFYITNDRRTPRDQIVTSANDRCRQEKYKYPVTPSCPILPPFTSMSRMPLAVCAKMKSASPSDARDCPGLLSTQGK
jgi:hypothetical protein